MTTVVLLDNDFPDVGYEHETCAAHGVELRVVELGSRTPDRRAVADADGLLLLWSTVSSDLIAAAPHLRVIGRYGTGVDMIDVEAATARGIAVVNSGVYATEEVATHAVTLGLALVRRVMVGDRAVRAGAWPAPADLGRLRRLSTLRVGILGYGRIGRMTADAYRALGCIVTVHAPSRADEARSAGFDVTATPDALLRGSDILSIHVGLTEATRGMIGRRELGLLPEGAVVVNTGRGAVIDEEALVAALESGRLAGAGLDVFAAEPLPLDHPLRTHPNAVVTPHTAYYSEESLQACREHTVTSLLDALAGRQPRTLVNDVVISSMADTSRR